MKLSVALTKPTWEEGGAKIDSSHLIHRALQHSAAHKVLELHPRGLRYQVGSKAKLWSGRQPLSICLSELSSQFHSNQPIRLSKVNRKPT
jgi:hypothetical protein